MVKFKQMEGLAFVFIYKFCVLSHYSVCPFPLRLKGGVKEWNGMMFKHRNHQRIFHLQKELTHANVTGTSEISCWFMRE